MKNIFKSLMFVAVAAMTFTACEKDNAENNNNNGAEQKTTITFNAKMADTDTRTYFGDYDEENGYPTLLNGNEVAKFVACSPDNGLRLGNEAMINNGRFTVDLAVASGDNIYAYLPTSAWGEQYLGESGGKYVALCDYNFPSEQTPTDKSVDPKAHIFKATTTYNGEDNINLYFEHQVAYGKMSLRNFAGTDATAVILDIDGTKYTIKLDNIDIATDPIWFACEPDSEISNMTVIVNATEGGYTKQIITDGNKNLKFLQGKVSTFGVNMEGVTSGDSVEIDPFDDVDIIAETCVSKTSYIALDNDAWPNPSNYLYIYVNSKNHPNNNSLIPGTYNGCGNSSPSETEFGAKFNYGFDTNYAGAFTSSYQLVITYDEINKYTIILSTPQGTVGYRGMPNGWEAPAEGGNDGDEDEEPAIDLTGFSACNLTSFTKGAQNFVATITLSDKIYGDAYTFSLADVTGINATNKTLATGEYTFVESFNSCEMEASGFTYYGSTYNVTGTVTVYNQNGTYTIKCDCKINPYSSIKLYYQGTL